MLETTHHHHHYQHSANTAAVPRLRTNKTPGNDHHLTRVEHHEALVYSDLRGRQTHPVHGVHHLPEQRQGREHRQGGMGPLSWWPRVFSLSRPPSYLYDTTVNILVNRYCLPTRVQPPARNRTVCSPHTRDCSTVSVSESPVKLFAKEGSIWNRFYKFYPSIFVSKMVMMTIGRVSCGNI